MKNSNDSVVLLHGMGRTYRSMKAMAAFLTMKGYSVVNIAYPSTRETIPIIIEKYIKPELNKIKNRTDSKIHFVTHSLGGILVRQLLQTEALPLGSKIVMLCPPNHGSEIVDRFKNSWWFQKLNGPAGQVLGTEQSSLPNQLKSISYDVGIITGTKSYEPWFSALFNNANDGKVSVESARLDEMKDFLVVNLGHTFIMKNKNVIMQTYFFFKNAYFESN